ncbi:AraC-type DNA-binding protein [Fontibacillus panacisegetis]|uniref:AraC-type DNA-binding protein n=1 Tax=Fontibacillus panacisegetis TaxID=670482 RepID=A0A1G7RK31_9BACL|nr:AraC family transcriptional regulator [Fontibacillus panacisegetis]SDG11063.1 AraC-type DNA-binding protein [Fontibacillus panacisegetis]
MIEDRADWYDIESLHPKHHLLADNLNSLYRTRSCVSKRLQIPEQFGQGFWKRFKVNSVIDIAVCEMSFHEDIEMSCLEQNDSIKWGYSLGAPIEWEVRSMNRAYQLNYGEMSVFGHQPADCVGAYRAGTPYCGITVKIDRKYLEGMLFYHTQPKGNEPYFTHIAPPSIHRIFREMLDCNYEDNIKRIYLEGKVLELAAVYLHELMHMSPISAGLSRTDIESLLKAKEILDHDLVGAPGIQELSKKVCLNEFKLKKGFKQLFGLPIHAYVIDCRLEVAYKLLESGSSTVTMAAAMAGFSNPSYFAEKFRQKYGAIPSRFFGRT